MPVALFNSLDGAIAGTTGVDIVDPAAASFSTGAAATLSGVHLGLYLDTGIANALTGTLTVTLRGDSATTPGATVLATLGTIAHASLPTLPGGTLDLAGFAPVTLAAGTRYWIELTDSGAGVTWTWTRDLSGTGVSGQFVNNSFVTRADSVAGAPRMEVDVACYAEGTQITTPISEAAIERLVPGDHVLTADGRAAPVKWIGRRSIDVRRHPRPDTVWPVEIAPDAIAPGMPRRPLRLSPDHAILIDGVLVPVRHLVNGATITRRPVDSITYFHVELDQHDILLAEGMPAESYLDTGNRAGFENAPTPMLLHPDFRTLAEREAEARSIWAHRACAPLLESGLGLAALRHRLHRRAVTLGHTLSAEPGLHVVGDTGPLTLRHLGGGMMRALLPAGCRGVTLLSPSGIPAETDPEGTDWRRLGVMLTTLLLRGSGERHDLLTIDAPGLHALEQDATGSWRWTDGAARLTLPPGAGPRFLDIAVAAAQPAWCHAVSGAAPAIRDSEPAP